MSMVSSTSLIVFSSTLAALRAGMVLCFRSEQEWTLIQGSGGHLGRCEQKGQECASVPSRHDTFRGVLNGSEGCQHRGSVSVHDHEFQRHKNLAFVVAFSTARCVFQLQCVDFVFMISLQACVVDLGNEAPPRVKLCGVKHADCAASSG